jgi:hypothetical protein
MSDRKIVTLKLHHSGIPLGTISDLYGDFPCISGTFSPNDAGLGFKRFFDACTDEENDPPDIGGEFPDRYFDDELWYVILPDGKRREIFLPAVHWDDMEITWRWRDCCNDILNTHQ